MISIVNWIECHATKINWLYVCLKTMCGIREIELYPALTPSDETRTDGRGDGWLIYNKVNSTLALFPFVNFDFQAPKSVLVLLVIKSVHLHSLRFLTYPGI